MPENFRDCEDWHGTVFAPNEIGALQSLDASDICEVPSLPFSPNLVEHRAGIEIERRLTQRATRRRENIIRFDIEILGVEANATNYCYLPFWFISYEHCGQEYHLVASGRAGDGTLRGSRPARDRSDTVQRGESVDMVPGCFIYALICLSFIFVQVLPSPIRPLGWVGLIGYVIVIVTLRLRRVARDRVARAQVTREAVRVRDDAAKPYKQGLSRLTGF